VIDLTDPDTFEMWHDQFVNALSGSATDYAKVDEVIGYADRLAQAAVALIQKRAAEKKR
jgi:hypothetical protein